MSAIPYIIPSAVTKVIEIGRADNRRKITVQVCDLFIPTRRNALDYEYNIEDSDALEADTKHFLSGDIFKTNAYGVELNNYGITWVAEKDYYEELTKLLQGK